MRPPAINTPVTLRLMTERDLPLLHAWLNRPHVVQWWDDEVPTLESVRSKYAPRLRGEDGVTLYIALLGETPFGFAQSYVVAGAGEGWWEDETDPGARGIDQIIGEPGLVGRGLGTRLAKALVARLFEDPAVTKVQVDPATTNARAIRCYEKAGFIPLKVVVTPDGPAVYMLQVRPAR
jgi:AacA4 family aminoglycoside N(6')-acetyltransferase